jgi:hypothetical protein
MTELLTALGEWEVARALAGGRWSYAAVSAAHVLGIALLVGGILPLDLRLLGLWPRAGLDDVARVLVPTAGCGLLLAATTGVLLFSVQPLEYARVPVLWAKLALIALGATGAVLAHARFGRRLERAQARARRLTALASMSAWLGALVCGRLIAFTGP